MSSKFPKFIENLKSMIYGILAYHDSKLTKICISFKNRIIFEVVLIFIV